MSTASAVLRDLLDHLENQENQVLLVHPDLLVNQDHKDHKVNEVRWALVGSPDSRAREALVDHVESQVLLETLVPQDFLVLGVREADQGRSVVLAKPGQLDLWVREVHLAKED